jgi:hypothetical protein
MSSPARPALLDVLASFYLHTSLHHIPGVDGSRAAYLTGLRQFCSIRKDTVTVDAALAQLDSMQGDASDTSNSQGKLLLNAGLESTKRGHGMCERMTMAALLKYRQVSLA